MFALKSIQETCLKILLASKYVYYLKNVMYVSFDRNCLHNAFLTIFFKAVTPTPVNIIHACQNITEKTTLLKKCDPQI